MTAPTAPAKPSRFPLLAAGILGLTGVALGAMGAHALRVTLAERGTLLTWETAARYNTYHALAALAVAAWLRAQRTVPPSTVSTASPSTVSRSTVLLWAVRLWCAGVVLFSGSLYCLALGGPRWIGTALPPFGGIAFLLGWLAVIVAALLKDENQ